MGRKSCLTSLVAAALLGSCTGTAADAPPPSTVAPATTATSSVQVSTSNRQAPATIAGDELPLDDLDEIVSQVDGLLAGSPGSGDVAELLAALNRMAQEVNLNLGGYDKADRKTVESRLDKLKAGRRRLGDRLTRINLDSLTGAILGPALDPNSFPELPGTGIAVDFPGGAVLLDLDGEVLGHLEGYSLDYASYLPGPVLLRDTMGEYLLLAPGATSLVSSEGTVPLAYGVEYVVEPPSETSDRYRRMLIGDDWSRTVDGDLIVAAGRAYATDQLWIEQDDDVEPGVSTAIDLADGSDFVLPNGCWLAAEHGATRYLACSRLEADGSWHQQLVATDAGGGEVPIGAAPDVDYEMPVGHWRWLLPSPDGATLLGQWSAECEIPTAFLIPTDGSAMITAVEGISLEDAPTSFALGWSETGDALVLLEGAPGCSVPSAEPGIHRLGASGGSEWLYDTGSHYVSARMWQQLGPPLCEPDEYTVELLAEPATAQLAISVSVRPVGKPAREVDLTGTLVVTDGAGDPADIVGNPFEIDLAGIAIADTGESSLSQTWVWQDWCDGEMRIRLDLNDGISAEVAGAPRCNGDSRGSTIRRIDPP